MEIISNLNETSFVRTARKGRVNERNERNESMPRDRDYRECKRNCINININNHTSNFKIDFCYALSSLSIMMS